MPPLAVATARINLVKGGDNATATTEEEVAAAEASLKGTDGGAKTHSKAHGINWWREQAKTRGGAPPVVAFKSADSRHSLSARHHAAGTGEGLGDRLVKTTASSGRELEISHF